MRTKGIESVASSCRRLAAAYFQPEKRKEMRSFKRKTTILGAVLFMGILGLGGRAMAQAPKPNVFDGGNRWLITFYDDCNAAHEQWATQGICFLPYESCGECGACGGIKGAWYSDTFPDWNGRYMQQGDRILMHGDYANNVGHDSMVIELFAGTSPQDEGAGQWTEWREAPGFFGDTIGFGNNRLRRAGRCQITTGADISTMSPEEIDKLAAELSAKVRPRLRKDGKPAEFPVDPEQVRLPEEGGSQRQ
jgi:hypothetical protein